MEERVEIKDFAQKGYISNSMIKLKLKIKHKNFC